MAVLDDVLTQPTGARFVRADMHIHSFGASHDVRDSTMTPQAIVRTAAQEGLSVIAITDHNEIGNVDAALRASEGTSVTVIPGVELSTPQGHLLCYLPTLPDLRRFHGLLQIADSGTQTSHCKQGIFDCLELLHSLGGFGVLAHVDIQSGFETEVPGASPHKANVICHPALLGIELKHATSQISYADGDPDANRVQLGRSRVERLKLGSRQYLARVLNSDAHALNALGRNAASLQRVTRYKMDAVSFHGLRIALEDADARVRIEDQIPQTIPRILGVQFEGGFLASQTIQFSTNLNCIIGGRGTGKSTAFEAIRCLSGEDSGSAVIDSEVWPDEAHLFWQDQAGQRHSLLRRKDGEIENVDDPDFGPRMFEVDCFGQGEPAKISREAQTDPLALLRYLDRFVVLDDAVKAEDGARDRLLSLQDEIEKAEQQVNLIPQFERALATTKQQLAALQQPGVKELIELQRHLAAELEIRNQITKKLQEAKQGIGTKAAKKTIQNLQALGDPKTLSVGSKEFEAIIVGAATFELAITAADTQLKEGLARFEQVVTEQFVTWKSRESEAQKKVDEKRRELEAMQIPFDMSYINKLTRDEAGHQQSLTNLAGWKVHLDDLRKQRKAELVERWRARERVATLRDAFGRAATETLRQSLSDLEVSLKYDRNAYSPEAAELIIGAMGWKTSQQARAAWLVETLTVPALLEAINRNDSRPLLAIKNR